MASLPVLSVLLLAFSASTRAQFGATCQGGVVPDVAALANNYPPLFTVAQIVQGDTVARNLFNSIQGPALAYQPSNMVNGAPTAPPSYNAATDNTCWWTASQCFYPKVPGIPNDAHTCPPAQSWGLSFDDGPTCVHGPLYQLLQQNKQEASLFYIGSNVASYPNEARLGYDNGHTICVHTWSHHYTTSLTNEQVFAELYYTKKIIKDVLGVTPRCWRPPYGDVDDRVRTYATALELYTFIWDNDTQDWAATPQNSAPEQANYQNIINGNYGQQGTMVLSHEISAQTVALFQQFYPQIRQRFSHVVAAHTCYNITAPYAETGAPVYANFAAQAANQQLQTLQAPTTAGTSGPVVFAGQAAFFDSLNGTVPAPSASAVTSALTSSTTAGVAATTSSASPSSTPVLAGSKSDNQIAVGAIVGAAVGGVALAIVVAVLAICARRRGWLCFGASKSKNNKRYLYSEMGTPETDYSEKFSRSEQALLYGDSSSRSLTKGSTSDVNLPAGLESYRDSRPLSSSQVDLTKPYSDETPPVTPKTFAFSTDETQPAAPRRSFQQHKPRTSSIQGNVQYISQN